MPQNGVSITGAVICAFALGSAIGWIWAGISGSSTEANLPNHVESERAARVASGNEPSLDALPKNHLFNARMEEVLAIRSPLKRDRCSSAIADGLDPQQIRAALQKVERTHIPERERILRALFARWGELEPQEALAYARALKDEYAFRMMEEVTRGWARKDFDAALNATRTMEIEVQSYALVGVLEVLSETDPKRAFELAKQTGTVSGVSLRLFANWSEKNPAEAAACALDLPETEGRSNAIGTIARAWAQADLQGAVRWAESLPDKDAIGMSAWSSPATSVFSAWADEDPDAAIRWLEDMPPSARRSGMIDFIKSEIGERVEDPALFARFVVLLPPGTRRSEAWGNFMFERGEADLAGAIAWAREQPNDLQDATIPNLARKLALDDPAAALELTASLSDKAREAATAEVLTFWGIKDPKSASKWAQDQPPNAEYFKGVVRSFIAQDLAGATQWVNELSPSPAKDEMLNDIVERVQQRNPRVALAWIEGISDVKKREGAYQQLARDWLYNDPAAARKWIESAPIPEKARAEMLKATTE